MRRWILIISINCLALLFLLSGVAVSQKVASTKTFDIGIATPLTGPAAHLGTMIKNGILIAIDEQNHRGGIKIAGEKYILNPIIRDTKKDAAVGKAVAEELIYGKKVKVIAGPFIDDAVAIQAVTEPNKVISFFVVPAIPGMCSPDKPYSFFCGGFALMMMVNQAAYIPKFYPQAKTVLTMQPDLPDAPLWADSAKTMFQYYGLNWLGYERFPFTITDFMPVISRALAKKPDIIDTSSTGGAMGGMCALLIKQLREAGFKGIISVPTAPPPGLVEEVVPKEHLTKVLTNDVDWENPIVSKEYRDFCRLFVKKYNMRPTDMPPEFYRALKPFFEFLDGQNTMDTTNWMKGFEKHRWKDIYGREATWIGKPIFGINRLLFRSFWVSEYTNGKLETKWEAPIPMEFFVEKK
jgi:branched-chain amino acid transport system substrate-binding protein